MNSAYVGKGALTVVWRSNERHAMVGRNHAPNLNAQSHFVIYEKDTFD